MGKMKQKLIDLMESPDFNDESGLMDSSDEYEVLLPKGMKVSELWEKIDRERDEDGDPEELDFGE